MKKILSFFLAMVTIVCVLPTAAFADAELNAAVRAKSAELSEKYGVTIEYPTTESGDTGVALASFEILDESLATVTPSVVQQVSAFYNLVLGHKLVFEYRQTNSLNAGQQMINLAGFQPSEGRVVLNLSPQSGTTVMTGDSPLTIVHEFGHAVHFLMQTLYGSDKMRAEWLSFNSGIAYDPAYIAGGFQESVFLTGYGATMYEEDFAEVFAHCFIRNKAGQGFTWQLSSGGKSTGLGRKVAYMDDLLATLFPKDAEMLTNFRKTLNAPTETVYQGMHFSGAYLQFMGFPQPRHILNGTLNYLGKEREYAVWLRSIGAWYVREPSGEELIVFPGLNVAVPPPDFEPPEL